MSFTAADVKALREKTGLGMMDCKKALTEHNGDAAAAEEWLREQRKGKMDERTERAAGEGRIAVRTGDNWAAMIEVITETDFTARNDDFVAMVDKVADHAVNCPTGCITATEEMTKTIDDMRIVTGENMSFSRGVKLEGGNFGVYIHHDAKRAVILQFDGDLDADSAKGICQHITFHDPIGIDETSVSADKIEEIRAAAIQEAEESGKPTEIAQKMSEGTSTWKRTPSSTRSTCWTSPRRSKKSSAGRPSRPSSATPWAADLLEQPRILRDASASRFFVSRRLSP